MSANRYIQDYPVIGIRPAYLSAVKKSERNGDTILRIVEENGENTVAGVTIGDCKFSVPLKPFEIRTITFDGSKIHKVNMLEEQ